MRHAFRKDYHRATCYRHDKANERGCLPGSKKLGRGFSEETVTESFILFAGACITLQNTLKHCAYGDVFNGEKQGRAGFRYHKVPDDLYKRLAESQFPPQLLAVVVSDVIPLDLITRGGRHSSSRIDFAGKVKNMTWKQVLENEKDHAQGRPNQSFILLDAFGENGAPACTSDEISYTPDVAADIDARNGWKEPNETQPDTLPQYRALKRIKGTPVCQILFHGLARISSRMACYWRNDCRQEYNRCRAFIESLITTELPRAPFFERPATTGKLVNEKFLQELRQRTKNRPAMTNPPAGPAIPDPEKFPACPAVLPCQPSQRPGMDRQVNRS